MPYVTRCRASSKSRKCTLPLYEVMARRWAYARYSANVAPLGSPIGLGRVRKSTSTFATGIHLCPVRSTRAHALRN